MIFPRIEMCCPGEQAVALGQMTELRGIVPWRSKERTPPKRRVSAMALDGEKVGCPCPLDSSGGAVSRMSLENVCKIIQVNPGFSKS